MNNNLIFGKNDTNFVVGLEPDDNGYWLITESPETGKVEYEFKESSYWILTNKKVSDTQTRLEGNQFYRFLGEIKTPDAFMDIKKKLRQKHFDFYTVNNLKENIMIREGITYYKGFKSPADVSILFFDIETVGLEKNSKSKVLLISNTFRKGNKVVKKLFAYDEYETEAQFFGAWCEWVREMDPSIMCGHNIFGYDLPYLNHCAVMAGTTLNLGRNESELTFNSYPSKFRKDGSQSYEYFEGKIWGREIVDTFFLSIKYDIGRQFISYGLKSIINQLGKEKIGRTFYDAALIKDNYMNVEEWLKIKAYAIDDADDALTLFDLMIPSFFYFTQNVSKPFQTMMVSATGSQINNLMVRSYLQIGHSIAQPSERKPFQGALSLGIPGVYKNCVRWDVASLYPSIMRQFKIYSPKKDPNKNFLYLVEHYTLERLKNKKLAKETGEIYYKDLESSQKVAANSLYGFLAAGGLNYNYVEGADLVTTKGREILSKAVFWASGKTTEELFTNTNFEVEDDD